MTSRIVCSACGASNGEFAARCASCDAGLTSASLGSTAGARGAATHDSIEGCDVGPYRVEERLGAGATGAVYKATDVRLLRPVALKVLSENLSPNDRARGRMLREARAAARLKSRHVVQVLDHGVWRNRPYIAMEYLEGHTLRAHLAQASPLSPTETVRWISQIAAGLEKAHAAGIVHRDLKPENVFLAREDEGWTAKILDFGVAKALGSWADVAATHTGTLLGTPAYMSPEQANGASTLDHRSDLWSLGVIAFECLTGRRPFGRQELGALCVQILSEPLPVPSSVAPGTPPAFDAWWRRAAARDPSERFQSAGDLASTLSEALSAGAESPGWTLSEPREKSAIPPKAHRPNSNARVVLLALFAALALAGLSAVSLPRRGGPAPAEATPATASPAPSGEERASPRPSDPAPASAPAPPAVDPSPRSPDLPPSKSPARAAARTATTPGSPGGTAPPEAPSPSGAPALGNVEPRRDSLPPAEPEPGMWNQRD